MMAAAAPPGRCHFDNEPSVSSVNVNANTCTNSNNVMRKPLERDSSTSASTEATSTSTTSTSTSTSTTISTTVDGSDRDKELDAQTAHSHSDSCSDRDEDARKPAAKDQDEDQDQDQDQDQDKSVTTSTSTSTTSSTIKPTLKRSPSKSPKLNVTFAALPPGTAIAPDLDAEESKPKPKSPILQRPAGITHNNRARSDPTGTGTSTGSGTALPIPTPRGRGLRARRQPQTPQDRDNRRRQIMQRTGSLEASDHDTNTNNNTNANTTRALPSPVPIPHIPPIPGISNSLAHAHTNTHTQSPAAPGDNLVQQNCTPRTRTNTNTNTNTKADAPNPSPNDYAPMPAAVAAADNAVHQAIAEHSTKQRIRRQNQANAPASIRPGAYKEIPGRGLVRNDTLRFSIMTAIQSKKKSLRRMFSSRRHTFSSMRGSTSCANLDTSNNSDASDPNEKRQRQLRRSASARSIKSIPSVLVSDECSDSKSYLGNISFRSVADAQQHGFAVARPVYQREQSTLEALCIIPGDMAVAVALDEQIKESVRSDTEARLRTLRLEAQTQTHEMDKKPPPTPHHGKRAKARRMVAAVVTKPKQIAKFIKQSPKILHPKNWKKKPRRTKSAYDHRSTPLAKTNSIAKLPLSSSGAARRHSF